MANSRSTVYNNITSEDKIKQINKNNINLMEDFLDYLKSIDRSPQTIEAYKHDLLIFFTYVLDNLDNKDFIKITKRDFARFQSHCLDSDEGWGWSPKRIRRVKSSISSMSSFIENMLDEEEQFEDYKKVINKIENPANVAVREKTVLTDEEVELILNTFLENKEYQKCCAVAILAYSGMRKAELLQMKPEFFDKEHLVFGSLHQTDLIRAKGRGKNGHQMRKWIMVQGDKYIMPWLKEREKLNIDNEYLFVKKNNNEYVKLEYIDHYMDACSKIINKPVYAHSFRHYTCTRLMGDYNLPSEVVREFFQWESIEMTKIYFDRSAVDDFGKYFSEDGIKKVDNKSLSDL